MNKDMLKSFFVGFVIGGIVLSLVVSHVSGISSQADYVEKMLAKDCPFSVGILCDKETIGDVKSLYWRYHVISRGLLERELDIVCNMGKDDIFVPPEDCFVKCQALCTVV